MTDAMVKAEAVHKRFGRLEVLKGIDLQVRRGEVMCMLGPSGSGKSTFLRCVNHLEKINAGRLFVDGELVGYREANGKLHELHEREVARKRAEIGMVFQHFNLFPHMTALDNVTVAPMQVAGLSREVADTVVFMDDGVVVESGPPQECLANPKHERTRAFLAKVL